MLEDSLLGLKHLLWFARLGCPPLSVARGGGEHQQAFCGLRSMVYGAALPCALCAGSRIGLLVIFTVHHGERTVSRDCYHFPNLSRGLRY